MTDEYAVAINKLMSHPVMTQAANVLDTHFKRKIMDDYQLCTKRDEFIWDKTVWIATLQDDTEIWQDDDRPGIEETSAWIRLGDYVKASNNKIAKMHLRFRSNIIPIERSSIYYYTKGILSGTGMKRDTHFSCVGILNDKDVFEVTWYRLPELLPARYTTRHIAEVHGPEIIEGIDV